MNELAAFMTARLDEDEATAKAAYCEGPTPQQPTAPPVGAWWTTPQLMTALGLGTYLDARHIALHDPARVLRDVEADRKILAALKRAEEYSDHVFGPVPPDDIAPGEWPGERIRAAAQVLALEQVVKIRAERFDGHPDYRQEWKP